MRLAAVCAAWFVLPALGQQAPADDDSDIGEVIVTATRQVSTVNKVPLSITAVTRDTMEKQGIKDVQDLVRAVPSVTFRRDSNEGNPDISIRGVKSVQGAPTTGIYIDDVPIQKRGSPGGVTGNGSVFPTLYDLDRVEVLRGPQGTLYGSSAEGGAVRFITPTPSLVDTEVTTRAEVSSVDHGDMSYEGAIAAGGPIIEDKLGIRASAIYRRQGGYMDHVSLYTGEQFANNTNWRETTAGRLSMLWVATDNLRITPSLYYSKEYLHDSELFFGNIQQFTINSGVFTNRGATPGGSMTGGVLYDFPDKPFTGATFGPYQYLGPGKTIMGIYPDTTGTPEYAGTPRDTELFVPALTLDYDFGAATLKSITAVVDDEVTGYTPGVSSMFGLFPSVMPFSTNAQFVIPGSVATTCGNTSSITDDGVCRVPVTGGAGTNFIIAGFPQRIARSEYDNFRRTFSQELRLQSAADAERLSWIVGLFYSDAKYTQNLRNVGNDQDASMFLRGVGFEWFLGATASDENGVLLPVGVSGLNTYRHQITTEKELAIFGETSYSFTERWKGTIGVRVADTELEYFQSAAGGNGIGNPTGFVATPQPPTRITDPNAGHPFANQPGDPVYSISGEQKETPVTPKIGLSFQANDANLFYGTVSTGYRAGGVNIPASIGNCGPALAALGWTTTPLEYESDKLTSFELGAKNRFGSWQVNSSVFYIDWKNPQINQRLSQCAFNYLDNAGSAVSQGFDIQVSTRLGSFSFSGSAAYTDATFTETVLSQVGPGVTPQTIVRDGDTMGVPEWEFAASTQYDMPLGGHNAYIRADYQYSGDYLRTTGPGTISYDPIGYEGESFQNLALRFGVHFDDLELALFANNVTNDDSLLSVARPSGSFITYMSQPRPREIGLSMSYRF